MTTLVFFTLLKREGGTVAEFFQGDSEYSLLIVLASLLWIISIPSLICWGLYEFIYQKFFNKEE